MSIFQENLNACTKQLIIGGLILYPSDTQWAIGCDATNEVAIEKLHQLKKHTPFKPFISLVNNQAMLERYLEYVPEVAYDIVDFSEKPTTLVLDSPKKIAKNCLHQNGSVAIRVTSDKFCQYLVGKFGKPIISTTANQLGYAYPKKFKEIESEILKGVDYVVNLPKESKTESLSAIIKLSNTSEVKVLRK